MNSLPSNSLEAFAQTAEAVAATTKKLAKAALLGDYFQLLNDDDLHLEHKKARVLPANRHKSIFCAGS